MKIPSYIRPNCPVLLVAGLGGLFTVVNLASSQTWTRTSAPSNPWSSVASSADGTKLVAAGADYWDVAGYGHLQASPIYTQLIQVRLGRRPARRPRAGFLSPLPQTESN